MRRARGESLPFADRSFGTVFLLTTWAFLERPQAVLRVARRVLTSPGWLVNGYLDRNGVWGRSYVEKGRAGHPLFRHARFADWEGVKGEMERAGFAVMGTVSTLFSGPDRLQEPERPVCGYRPGASFVVVLGLKW